MDAKVKIKEIFISNYRSFASRSHEKGANISNLSNINIFIGPNESGKSNFFNAIRDCVGWHSFNSQGTLTIEKNHNHSNKPIEIEIRIEIDGETRTASLCYKERLSEQDETSISRNPGLKEDDFFKKHIYPIGLPRKFSEFNDLHREEINENTPEQDRSYAKILNNWKTIREDAKRIDIKLGRSCPKPPENPDVNEYADRFFYDVVDGNNVPILEESDGKANFLLMIVKIRMRPPGSVIIIEEPEVSMHPGLQKQFLEYLKDLSQKGIYQFLISTHSPYLMDLASIDESIKVFRVSKDRKNNTEIKLICNDADGWNMLLDLGHAPSDVLHPNGIIWVEGPSDLIYIRSWLGILVPKLTLGKDYEIMWYGGANLSHIGIRRCWKDNDSSSKLIDLFKLSPNWAFIVDSDTHNQSIAKGIQKRKDEIIKECKAQDKYWWKVDKCIEECVKKFMQWSDHPKSNKVEKAHQYEKKILSFDEGRLREKLNAKTNRKLDELIKRIENWA